MGDFATLLTGLNLSPVNTILLVGLVLAVKHIVGKFEARLTAIETEMGYHAESVARIEGRLDIEEHRE